ncbi:DUF4199 family protein [Flavobacteriaceae bacterium R38]|nr:DUF4199 family protein [Flavobacteriaceae bacterium R38]
MEDQHIEQPKNIRDFILPTAIIFGVARVIIDLLPKLFSAGPIVYYSTFLICFILEIIFISRFIKKYRSFNNGFLSIKQALLIGITMMVVIGTLYSISSYVYDTYVDSNFQIATTIAWAEMFGQGDAVRDQIAENPPNRSPIGILFGILWFTFIGFLISMIAGSVLKKSEND